MAKQQQREPKKVDELYHGAIHVEYEVAQFNDCVRRLTLNLHPERLLHNSLVTAFTIYTRNLYSFFYEAPKRKDDVVVTDYFDEPEYWKAIQPQPSDALHRGKQRVDKNSAHISYLRPAPSESPVWHWFVTHQEMWQIVRVFVENVDPTKITPKLRTFEHEWEWVDQVSGGAATMAIIASFFENIQTLTTPTSNSSPEGSPSNVG